MFNDTPERKTDRLLDVRKKVNVQKYKSMS